VIFQDQFFSKIQDIFVGFMRLDTENARFSVLTNLNQSNRSVYCSHKNVTKASALRQVSKQVSQKY